MCFAQRCRGCYIWRCARYGMVLNNNSPYCKFRGCICVCVGGYHERERGVSVYDPHPIRVVIGRYSLSLCTDLGRRCSLSLQLDGRGSYYSYHPCVWNSYTASIASSGIPGRATAPTQSLSRDAPISAGARRTPRVGVCVHGLRILVAVCELLTDGI